MNSDTLKNIVKVFLDKDSSYGELLNASQDLSGFFERYSHISTKNSHYELKDDSDHTYLDSGIAISPLDAAICTNEFFRTTKYIRGIYDAINDLLLRFEDKKLHIFYAGCGPYATLIIPILCFFDPKRLEVSFLDIHQSSLDSVKTILKSLYLEDFVSAYINEDATKYKLLKDTHLIITETMKAAFDDEPQVSISLNLLPQLNPNGIFIPQRVLIGFELSNYKFITKENMMIKKKDSEYLCDVIDLDSTKKIEKNNLIQINEYKLLTDFDKSFEPQFTTTIFIYKDHILGENECSLNIPKKVKFDRKLSLEDKILFEYEFCKKPKIIAKLSKS